MKRRLIKITTCIDVGCLKKQQLINRCAVHDVCRQDVVYGKSIEASVTRMTKIGMWGSCAVELLHKISLLFLN